MSKRVMILLAIGFLCVVASFFLHKHEVNSQGNEPESDQEPEETETAADVQEETAATDASAGSDKTE